MAISYIPFYPNFFPTSTIWSQIIGIPTLMTLLFYSFVTESNYDHCAHGFGTIHWSLMSSSIGALPPILSEYGAYLCFTLGAHCRHPQLLWSVTVTTVSCPGANVHSPSPYLGALPSFPAPFPPCSQSLRGSGVNVLLRAKHSIVTNLFSASWTDIHLCIHRCSLWTGVSAWGWKYHFD